MEGYDILKIWYLPYICDRDFVNRMLQVAFTLRKTITFGQLKKLVPNREAKTIKYGRYF